MNKTLKWLIATVATCMIAVPALAGNHGQKPPSGGDIEIGVSAGAASRSSSASKGTGLGVSSAENGGNKLDVGGDKTDVGNTRALGLSLTFNPVQAPPAKPEATHAYCDAPTVLQDIYTDGESIGVPILFHVSDYKQTGAKIVVIPSASVTMLTPAGMMCARYQDGKILPVDKVADPQRECKTVLSAVMVPCSVKPAPQEVPAGPPAKEGNHK